MGSGAKRTASLFLSRLYLNRCHGEEGALPDEAISRPALTPAKFSIILSL
jgi:hypothetical protein